MAQSARGEEETKEFFDSPAELDHKVTILAQWVRESKHTIAFTGAGISTAAGIPDFRSGINTSLETGPGKWELQAHKQARPRKCKTMDAVKAIPTATHMMFVRLHQEGLLQCMISQNTDGLHRKSGLPTNTLYELHGNRYLEKCVRCKREYLRDYRVRTSKKVHDHSTGNLCDNPQCRGKMKDTIINFGESLPQAALDASCEHAEKADLCLAMGSSLTVTPAADVPEKVGERDQRLVIVNLQSTPLDPLAKLRIFAKCDDVSKLLMAKLGLEIAQFKLRRRIVCTCEAKTAQGLTNVIVAGADTEGHPFSFLKQVVFSVGGRTHQAKGEPFSFPLRWTDRREVTVAVEVFFHSHYGEPSLQQTVTVKRGKNSTLTLDLEFTPGSGEWVVHRSDEGVEQIAGKLEAAKLN